MGSTTERLHKFDLNRSCNPKGSSGIKFSTMQEENESKLTKDELGKLHSLFKKRGYSLTSLDLLDNLKECYSAKKIVLQLLKTLADYVVKHDFMNQVEKDELELHFAAISHFTELINEAA